MIVNVDSLAIASEPVRQGNNLLKLLLTSFSNYCTDGSGLVVNQTEVDLSLVETKNKVHYSLVAS